MKKENAVHGNIQFHIMTILIKRVRRPTLEDRKLISEIR